jgi:hypothetical protein
MVENLILIPLTFPTVYGTPSNSIGMRRYERLCQVNPTKKYRLAQPFLQVGPISECRNTINTGYMCTFE